MVILGSETFSEFKTKKHFLLKLSVMCTLIVVVVKSAYVSSLSCNDALWWWW